jgi:CRP/FNR family cyclic AMP-dependent transcriptional regulator
VYSDVGARHSGVVMAKKLKKAPFDVKAFLATVDGGRTLSRYRKEEAIFSQGDLADAVFYIQKGQVKLTVVSEQGKEAVVALSGPDEFFGALAAEGHRTTSSATIASSVGRAHAIRRGKSRRVR